MPQWSKVSHISFSVTDAEASATWLATLLDMRELDRVEGEGWRAVLLVHEPSGTVLEFQQHDANTGAPFEPARTGLDHVGFKVDSRAELDDWADRLAALGVDFTPVVDRDYGSVLTFRHPDGIQLEMFFRPDHP